MSHSHIVPWGSIVIPDGWAVWGVVVSTRWWLLVDHCVLRNWDRILVRAVKGLISRAGMVSICPLLWQRDVKLQQTMGYNLRTFENTFWNPMAALKCACIFWSIMVMVISSCTSYGKGVWPYCLCGSICKIDLCLDIFGPYNCWENLFCQKNCPRPPDPRFQIFSQFPDSR